MNTIELQKNNFIALFNNNNITELEKFIKNNNFSMREWNKNNKCDILIQAIENNASYKMIQLILKYGPYNNLNYTFNENKLLKSHYETLNGTFGGYYQYKPPLFIALLKNNFRVAELLIENKADINYFTHFENIVDYLYNRNGLTTKNLRFILSKGVRPEYFFMSIPTFIKDFKNEFLEIIFKHYLLNNSFILNLINIYKSRKSLSCKQLKEVLRKEKNKIYIHELSYKAAIETENFEAILLLLENDGKEEENILEVINDYKILEIATERNKTKLVKKILSFNKIYL